MTCLILGIGGKILAVKMCGQDDTPWSVWVFCCDHICEVFGTVWRRGDEFIFFYVPVELAKGGNEVISDEGVVFGVGYISAD